MNNITNGTSTPAAGTVPAADPTPTSPNPLLADAQDKIAQVRAPLPLRFPRRRIRTP